MNQHWLDFGHGVKGRALAKGIGQASGAWSSGCEQTPDVAVVFDTYHTGLLFNHHRLERWWANIPGFDVG